MERIVRLSAKEAAILQLLTTRGEMYGLEMVAASPEALKAGTIYVTLQRMADKGLVESRVVKTEHERGLPRRLFKPTGIGERALRVWQLTGAFWHEATT